MPEHLYGSWAVVIKFPDKGLNYSQSDSCYALVSPR